MGRVKIQILFLIVVLWLANPVLGLPPDVPTRIRKGTMTMGPPTGPCDFDLDQDCDKEDYKFFYINFYRTLGKCFPESDLRIDFDASGCIDLNDKQQFLRDYKGSKFRKGRQATNGILKSGPSDEKRE